MLRLILVYASSTGLQRAMVFLAAPLLSRIFALDQIGQYTLIQTTGQFIIPLLTWNASVALTREAVDHPAATYKLLRLVCAMTVCAGLIGLLLSGLPALPTWIAYGLMLGAAEAGFASSSAVLQGREAATQLLFISLAKTLGFVAIVVAVSLLRLKIESLFIAQIVNSGIAALLAFVVARRQLLGDAGENAEIDVRTMLRYSAATLPHTAALWLSVSADRLLLGALRGKAEVGAYALAYTVAQAVTLMMSGVIAALPPRIARDPDTWRDPQHVVRFIRMLTWATMGIMGVMFACLLINRHLWTLIDKMPSDAPLLVALLGLGFYGSLYYVLFASYMYLNRDTGSLARSGFIIGPVNLLVMAGLVHLFGAVGAAAGLMFCYAGFGIAYGRISLKLEPALREIVRPATLLFLMLASLSVGAGWLLS